MLKKMLKTMLMAFALAWTSVSAQVTLTGKVLDAETRAPLTGATVQIQNSKWAAITDESGAFTFQNIPETKATLIIRFVGFEPLIQEVDLTQTNSVELLLTASSMLTDNIIVTATRATEKSPMTFSTIDKVAIQKQNFGQDLPMVMNWMPSVVTTSDAGAGVGYTGIRIRGSDATRINVTINGIPYNDSESQGVYWVDVPDIATSTQNIQVQRGVGTSSNGAGAFGATINLQTNALSEVAYADVINSMGSFGTFRHTIGVGTGKMANKFSFDARVSSVSSDGFIDRASSDLKSYYLAGGYYGDKTIVKAIVFGGREITYQSWYGVPESKLNNDEAAMQETAAAEGWNAEQTANLLSANPRTFNLYTYKNQEDNYGQYHYQLHVSHRFRENLTANVSGHYTKGKGYYEEFRYDQDFADYGLADAVFGAETITSTDLIRRRWLDNDFYGVTWSLQWEKSKWNTVLGGGWNHYDGDHFGEIIWADVSTTVPKDYRYYFNNGLKTDFNVYAKTYLQLNAKLTAFADVQLRTINYTTSGTENKGEIFAVDQPYTFFNPKVGYTLQVNPNLQHYLSFAVANREPVRDDFVDAPAGVYPKHESLYDWEAGIRLRKNKFSLNGNLYWMNYQNQLVLTGAINESGSSIRTNVGKSYRAGLELDGRINLSAKFSVTANLTFSQNKIKKFTEVLYDYGVNFDEFNEVQNEYTDTDIAYSPNVISGSGLSYKPFRGFEATWLLKHVGKQFLDNTSNDQRSIDTYTTNDLRLSYTFNPAGMREVSFSFLLNNILDVEYESNGYTYGYLGGSTAYRQNFYYPQAGRNFMAMMSLRF
jgi:iron complex outermembrane receptor protein